MGRFQAVQTALPLRCALAVALAILPAAAGAQESVREQLEPASAPWHLSVALGPQLHKLDQTWSDAPISYSGVVPLSLAVDGDYHFARYFGLLGHADYASFQLSQFADRPDQPAVVQRAFEAHLGPAVRVPLGENFAISAYGAYAFAQLDGFKTANGLLTADPSTRHGPLVGARAAFRSKLFGAYALAEKPFALAATSGGAAVASDAIAAGGGLLVRLASFGSTQLAATAGYRFETEHLTNEGGAALDVKQTSQGFRLGLALEPEAADEPLVAAKPPPPPPPEPEKKVVVAEAPKKARLSGVVLLGVDGPKKPLAGVAVAIQGGFGERKTETDAQGHFEFTDLDAGPVSLKAEKSGLRPASTAAMVVLGENAPMEVKLLPIEEARATLKGLVRTRDGKPIVATLSLKSARRELHTDDGGQFSAELTAGEETVTIKANGYLTQRKKVELKPGETVIFNIELYPARMR